MKLPINMYTVDHEVVTLDLFEDADGINIPAAEIVKIINAIGPPSDLEAKLTAAVREADLLFEKVGGSSRHYVRECLMPVLTTYKLRLIEDPE